MPPLRGVAIETVARISLIEASLVHHDLASQLDALADGLEWVERVLLPPTGELVDELVDEMSGIGSELLIPDSVELNEKWRG